MGEPSDRTYPVMSSEERLDSWKEIAAYLNRDVTTAQRWEKREGMPVHRHVHDRIGSVYAFRSELDAWTRSRKAESDTENGNGASAAGEGAMPGAMESLSAFGWKAAIALIAAVAILAVGAGLWIQKAGYIWRDPIAGARFQQITNSDGAAQAAALSRDGKLVAFLSDRSGQMDVWVTQAGSGEFHNLTHGGLPELVNPAIRPLGFSPDGSLVTFWARKQDSSGKQTIGVWAVPTLGGEPRPYLDDVAELDWSPDASRIAYHTIAAGDPLFVADGAAPTNARPIFMATAGLHAHFPVWSPDAKYVYFAQGTPPDQFNVWRIRPSGGSPEQITAQGGVSYPVLLNERTLLYLARDRDGTGPWLYGMDTERRMAHRLTFGPERYTSLAASADGKTLAVTVASPETTLWRAGIDDSAGAETSPPRRITLTTSTGRSPRLGPDYLIYVSATVSSESIWKQQSGRDAEELWSSAGAQIIGAPAISPDGKSIAFSALQNGQKSLYVMQSDGSQARMLTNSLDLQGDPAWTPDGKFLTTAANENGAPHLYRVPVSGGAASEFVSDYALDPAWAADGHFVAYSGPDVGTTFTLRAAAASGKQYNLPALTLTRGARHIVLLRDGHSLVALRGEIEHKNLWLVDLESGKQKQLTTVPGDFDIRDFDISPDGREIVLERVQKRSDVALIELPRR